MNLKEYALRPVEFVAGQDYPDAQQIRHDATSDGATASEVDMSVVYERRQFVANLVHLSGLRKAIQQYTKGE